MRVLNRFAIAATTVIGFCGCLAGFAACGGNSSTGAIGDDGGGDGTVGDDSGFGADVIGFGDGRWRGDGNGVTSGDGANSSDGNGTIDGNGTSEGGGASDAGLSPDVFAGGGSCLKLGSACGGTATCCSGACNGGVCSYPSCAGDTQACTSNGQCCSQTCTNGACASLGSGCGTLGNSCTSNGQCCSNRCAAGTCQPSSWCGQGGDICAQNGDCCTGVCNVATGQSVGTCSASPPSGPANCGLVDGMLCSGTSNDGGVVYTEAGVPTCGGACCSRSCAPWGPTGVLVCQPASGCHPVGDLCMKDSDCCGSPGSPYIPMGGPVTCSATGGGVGICVNPMGCKPSGDVCKLATMSCSKSCDCCSGNCENKDTCHQDNVGIPRCSYAQCVDAGAGCASSADCCSGAPCVPNHVDGGMPPYVCYGAQCVPSCGACTNNADCCPGSSCSNGVCGPCGSNSGSSSGGSGGGSGGSSGGSGGSSGGSSGAGTPDAGCSLYGQICTTGANCCNGVPCIGGRCLFLQ